MAIQWGLGLVGLDKLGQGLTDAANATGVTPKARRLSDLATAAKTGDFVGGAERAFGAGQNDLGLAFLARQQAADSAKAAAAQDARDYAFKEKAFDYGKTRDDRSFGLEERRIAESAARDARDYALRREGFDYGKTKDERAFGLEEQKLAGDAERQRWLRSFEERKQAAAEAAAAETAKRRWTTDDIIEYQQARKDGFQGGFGDWMAVSKRPQTVVTPGESAYDKAVGGAYGKRYVDLGEQAAKVPGTISNLDRLEALTKRPDFYSGPAGQSVTAAKQVLSVIAGDPSIAKSNEEFRALSNKMVFEDLGGLGTAISDGDRSFIERMMPNLSTTPEGNRAIIETMRKIQRRKQEVAGLARQYVATNGRLDAGFDQMLADYADKNPLFPQTSAPEAGTVEAGPDGRSYRFRGGDPSNPDSWEAVP